QSLLHHYASLSTAAARVNAHAYFAFHAVSHSAKTLFSVSRQLSAPYGINQRHAKAELETGHRWRAAGRRGYQCRLVGAASRDTSSALDSGVRRARQTSHRLGDVYPGEFSRGFHYHLALCPAASPVWSGPTDRPPLRVSDVDYLLGYSHPGARSVGTFPKPTP